MWIKICGNTSIEDAMFAAENGADALGFVFAESPRRVTIEQVRSITPHLPDRIETYGVFVHADFESIVSVVLECGLTGVQLHASPDETLPERLRSYFAESVGGGHLKILRALHYSAELDSQLEALSHNADVDGVLVDSRTVKAVGGTGVSFDWQAARPSFLRASPHLNLIAAGGLTPENVAEAIATLEPWGVDVVSGVEVAPGKKNRSLVRSFIQRAREAER